MTEKTMDNEFELDGNFCQFLGLKDDPATNMAYPSEWNYCYRSNPSSVPTLEHQRKFCLLESHVTCPIFLNEIPVNQPAGVPMIFSKHRRRIKKSWVVPLVLGIIVVGGVVFGARLVSRPNSISTSQPTSDPSILDPTGFVIINPHVTSLSTTDRVATTQSVANTTSPLPSETPQSEANITTPLPSVTPLQGSEIPAGTIHGLDMPIGTAHRFVIHRMQQGESLGGLAIQYNTSVEVITLVNYYMPDPIWADWLVVIPVNTVDVDGIPSFDAHMVVDGGISIENLASKLNVDVSNLIFYNGLEPGYLVSGGEWLLIPHVGE